MPVNFSISESQPCDPAASAGIADRYLDWHREEAEEGRNDKFAKLVGRRVWDTLPAAVRRRFERRISGTVCVAYVGEVTECRMNLWGRLLSHAARLIGGPLPRSCDTAVPANVTVSEDEATGGQFWVRQYGQHNGFPQVIQSVKRFSGPTGLEEYLGCGFGIALNVCVEGEALYFLSDHYFVQTAGMRLRLPRWLAPGKLTIGHIDCREGRFAFTLDLDHPLFGTLVHQVAIFSDEAGGQR